MSKLNGAAPPDPLDDLDEVIHELEGTEWVDETTETNIVAQPGSTVVVTTGKHTAMSKEQADEITLTDHGTAPKQSDPPVSVKRGLLGLAGEAIRKLTPGGLAVVLTVLGVAGIAAYVALHW